MNHNEFLIKYLTYNYQENAQLGKQCVAFNKLYAKQVQGIQLGSFNWEADRATYKAGWTYDPKYWNKLKVWTDKVKEWDHLIQKLYDTGHIGIVIRQTDNWYFLLNQNDGEYEEDTWGNGDWLGNNAIIIRHYRRTQRPILYIFRRK